MRKYLKKRHEKYYKDHKWHMWADLFFVVLILALLAIFLIIRHYEPRTGINLKISHSDNISSGSTLDFTINYSADKELKQNTLALKFPPNFVVGQVEPANYWNQEINTFYLPDLAKGSNGVLKVSGQLIGEVGKEEVLATTFNCASCGAGFINSDSFKINSSILQAEWQLKDQAYRQAEFIGTLNIKNTSNFPASGVLVKIDKNFQVVDANFNKQDNAVEIGNILAGESKTLSLKLLYDEDKRRDTLSASVYLGSGHIEYKQADISQELIINDPQLIISTEVDKSSANYSDELVYKFYYQNREAQALKNVTIDLASANPNLEISSTAILDSDNAKINNQIISLGNIASGASGNFRVAIKYRRLKLAKNQDMFLRMTLQYKLDEDLLKYNLNSVKTRLISDLRLKSGAYYYSPQGDQLGIGPLPPTVGINTHYWVFWEIDNYGNPLKSFKISGALPAGVDFGNTKSIGAGNLHFGEIGSRVAWDIDEIPESAGIDNYRVGFVLSLTPESSDVGQVLKLLSDINYTAYDSYANKTISGTLPDLDTNLAQDVLASGRGTVVAGGN